ncbi:MAG TPA: metalloregulator ArsR/SmtB family transcription factor [Bacteroidales bacterium]|nr:metalloregulator ArsR/SmtB family transcription factor [Bacteroidales bacterium]HPT10028.1 metalloregulator ArsR/SmtB family transcription factor [Bacteroidales bacterium]
MAYAKTDLFDQELNSTATLFKALAHPARLAILKYLAEVKVCITGDISDELPLSRTTMKQHLIELKNAGLIRGTVDGVRVNYCLNPGKIKEMIQITVSFLEKIDVEEEHQC